MQNIPHTLKDDMARPWSSSWRLIAGIAWLLIGIGCQESSEWDRQWEQMQAMLSHGQLQEAKQFLHALLPSIREKTQTDERYALVIYQLGEISRMEEGKTARPKPIIGKPCHSSRSPWGLNISEWLIP